jgi:hypothetical protein
MPCCRYVDRLRGLRLLQEYCLSQRFLFDLLGLVALLLGGQIDIVLFQAVTPLQQTVDAQSCR